VKLGVTVSPSSGQFEIIEHGSLVVSGRISLIIPTEPAMSSDDVQKPVHLDAGSALPLNSDDIYKELRLRGYDYGPTFRGILSADGTGKFIGFVNG